MEGTKHDQEKPRLDLVPPSMILGVASVLTFGAKKYGDNNWRRGIKQLRLFAAAMRHLLCWAAGVTLDSESGMPHLWHAACNVGMMIENEQLRPSLDNRTIQEYCENE